MKRFASDMIWWVLIVAFLVALLVVHACAGGRFFDRTTTIEIPGLLVLAVLGYVMRRRRMRNR